MHRFTLAALVAGGFLSLAAHAAPLRAVPEAAGAMLRFYAPDAAPLDIPAADVLKSLALNAQSGAQGDAANTYWSPVVEGDTIAMEIEIPAHVSPREVKLTVPAVSHLETSAAK